MSFLHSQSWCSPYFQKVARDWFLGSSCEQFQTWLVFQLVSILRSGQLSLEIVNRMSKQWKCFNMWYFPHKNISQIKTCKSQNRTLPDGTAHDLSQPTRYFTIMREAKQVLNWNPCFHFKKILNIKLNRSDIVFEANQVRFQNSLNVLQEFLYNLLDIE